jgi:antitoxin HigA-1
MLMASRGSRADCQRCIRGELLRDDILPALGRPRVEIAPFLGVSRQALHAVLAERAAVTPDMALRLGNLCGNGPELWLSSQTR